MTPDRPLVCTMPECAALPADVTVCPCYHAAIAEDTRTTWSRIDNPRIIRAAVEWPEPCFGPKHRPGTIVRARKAATVTPVQPVPPARVPLVHVQPPVAVVTITKGKP